MYVWDKTGIPHKGWVYIGMEDLGEDGIPEDDISYEQCEMCGKEKIRYIHILSHPDVQGEVRVGCVCAEKMTQNYSDPKKKERELRNRSNRRRNFLRQKWRETEKGFSLRYKGENITIVMSRYATWGVVFQGEWRWEYHGRKMRDIETAKLVAFDLFDELHKPQSQLQPYWDGSRWLHL